MIYQRELKKLIEAELNTTKIILITGPRQAGKTTLLQEIAEGLKQKQEQVYFYNFDRIADLEFFNNQQKIEAFLKIRSIKSKLYIFVDEVQRKKDAGNFFKYFYDAGLNVKFIFSGSSSLELTSSFGDALTGRKQVFSLLPLSILEIAESLGEELEFAKQGDPIALAKFKELIELTLVWGNYPDVVQKQESEQLKSLGELYESYVQRDVKDLLRVKNISGFNLLVKIIAHNAGKSVFVEDLVRSTGLHNITINSYLDILEGTNIIARTENYNPDFLDNLPKSNHYYFLDNGLRNYALGQLQSEFRTDYQQLAANLIYSELRKVLANKHYDNNGERLFHFQTYSDNHLDFIYAPKLLSEIIPIVVRYPDNNRKLGKKIHEYINTKLPTKLYIVTNNYEEEQIIKSCKILFVPLEQFIISIPKLIN